MRTADNESDCGIGIEGRGGIWPSQSPVLVNATRAMSEQSSPSSELTPEERLRQLAAILARGVRRYRRLARRYESDASDEPGESRGTCLEALRKTRLSVSRSQVERL